MRINTLQITQKHFDIDSIDKILKDKAPGLYKIEVSTRKDIWETYVRWSGYDWEGIHDRT